MLDLIASQLMVLDGPDIWQFAAKGNRRHWYGAKSGEGVTIENE
jgi:hypothetical protein